jgi:hypothetical protein
MKLWLWVSHVYFGVSRMDVHGDGEVDKVGVLQLCASLVAGIHDCGVFCVY